MKVLQLSLVSLTVRDVAAATLRGDSERKLADLYYPRYTGDYDTAWCSTTNQYAGGAAGLSTELECCKKHFPDQQSGKCFSMLPNPPTASPTPIGGPDIWYPNFDLDHTVGVCINTAPAPNGVLTYDSQVECCVEFYKGQTSGACLNDLPIGERPTASPTPVGGVDIWYPNFDLDHTVGVCINTLPTPNGVTTYGSQVECCVEFYKDQTSGACLNDLPIGERPTASPTPVGGVDAWYADYDLDWSNGVCINTLPTPNGRTIYDSQLECCKGAYLNQPSGACLDSLPVGERPTASPTPVGGVDAWYANYDVDWSNGVCINTLPTPNGVTIYDSQLECCKGAYLNQPSGACLDSLPVGERPTASPTPIGGPDAWYANFDLDWSSGVCINTAPAPNGRIVYESQLECCQEAYKGQPTGACLNDLPIGERPTASPTPVGGVDAWYADYNLGWQDGVCINTLPAPNGRNIYSSQLECCQESYYGQASGACLDSLPIGEQPTASPIGSDAPFFPIWSTFETGHCDNDPAKLTTGTKSYLYTTQAECCDTWFKGQASGACLSFDPTYGSRSPTQAPIM